MVNEEFVTTYFEMILATQFLYLVVFHLYDDCYFVKYILT